MLFAVGILIKMEKMALSHVHHCTYNEILFFAHPSLFKKLESEPRVGQDTAPLQLDLPPVLLIERPKSALINKQPVIFLNIVIFQPGNGSPII